MSLTRTVNGLPPALDDACKSLYVGNLDPRVTEVVLRDIFASVGEVIHTKIIPDKNYQHGGLNYGFVDMVDHKIALAALETLNGRKVLGHEIKVNWAYQGNNSAREDTSTHHHVFVGDLSADVTDQVLFKAFSAFGSLSDARVMWDMNTGKSRGYGFIAFRDREDAERAISSMSGEWLGSRAIRVNWANQRGQPDLSRPGQSPVMVDEIHQQPYMPMPMQPTLSYDIVVNQTSYVNYTVYVGNLAPTVREADLYPLFQMYGFVHEVRLQHDRGFAFVKMDTHEHAAMSICYLNGHTMHGRPLKVSWGKDKNAEMAAMGVAAGVYQDPMGVASPQGYASAYQATPQQASVSVMLDPATLPPLTDPIAAAAAAAAQSAVIYTQSISSSSDFYNYYHAYYGQLNGQ